MHRLGEAVGGRIGLVFVDGHSDFRHPGNASYVGAAAGEDLALVTGRGQADLAAIEGRRPYFRDIDVVVLGIRAQDEYRLDLQAAGIVTRPVPALRAEGAARSAQWARDQLADCAGYWVHVDVDVLDPAVMPAVDAPDAGRHRLRRAGAAARRPGRHPALPGRGDHRLRPRLRPGRRVRRPRSPRPWSPGWPRSAPVAARPDLVAARRDLAARPPGPRPAAASIPAERPRPPRPPVGRAGPSGSARPTARPRPAEAGAGSPRPCRRESRCRPFGRPAGASRRGAPPGQRAGGGGIRRRAGPRRGRTAGPIRGQARRPRCRVDEPAEAASGARGRVGRSIRSFRRRRNAREAAVRGRHPWPARCGELRRGPAQAAAAGPAADAVTPTPAPRLAPRPRAADLDGRPAAPTPLGAATRHRPALAGTACAVRGGRRRPARSAGRAAASRRGIAGPFDAGRDGDAGRLDAGLRAADAEPAPPDDPAMARRTPVADGPAIPAEPAGIGQLDPGRPDGDAGRPASVRRTPAGLT